MSEKGNVAIPRATTATHNAPREPVVCPWSIAVRIIYWFKS